MDFNWMLIFQIIETAALIAAVLVAWSVIKLREAEGNTSLYTGFEYFIQTLKS